MQLPQELTRVPMSGAYWQRVIRTDGNIAMSSYPSVGWFVDGGDLIQILISALKLMIWALLLLEFPEYLK